MADSSGPRKPLGIQLTLNVGAANDKTLSRSPVLAGEALLGDFAVKVDVGDEGIDTLVVLLLADEVEDEQAHGGVVEVGGELVQDVDLGTADGVLVEGVVADGHDHGEDVEGGVGAGTVRVRLRQSKGGVAEVDARGDGGDPRRVGVVDGEVGGGDAEL